jgi:hypothetical protein
MVGPENLSPANCVAIAGRVTPEIAKIARAFEAEMPGRDI